MVERVIYLNSILKLLDLSSIDRLRLRPIDVESGLQIVPHGGNPRFVLFLESGIASRTVLFRDGSQVEAGLIGSESIIGLDSLLGHRHMPHGTVIQMAGKGFYCRVDNALREFARFEAFHDMVLACMHASFSQAAQVAACNTRHEVLQRIPRWLLMCSDRLPDLEVRSTHEVICGALGVSRSTITTALDKLQEAGCIDCRRGRIRILDIDALRTHACECYSVMSTGQQAWIPDPAHMPIKHIPSVVELPQTVMAGECLAS